MRKNVFGKGLVLGLVFLIVVAGITPVFGMSMVTSKEDSAAVPSDRNSLADEVEKSSNMMTVTMVKLCNDNSIKNVREKISVKEYNEYAEKIKGCECGDIEGIFAVLQEYGIVPESMALDRFIQVMNSKIDKFGFFKNLHYNLRGGLPRRSDEKWGCWFTTASWNLEPIVLNFGIPLIFSSANSQVGGSVTACDRTYTGPVLDIFMFLYLGKLDMSPYIDLDGASFIGFVVYIDVWGG